MIPAQDNAVFLEHLFGATKNLKKFSQSTIHCFQGGNGFLRSHLVTPIVIIGKVGQGEVRHGLILGQFQEEGSGVVIIKAEAVEKAPLVVQSIPDNFNL